MCAAALLTRGANPRHADDSGVTALHLAACGGGVLVTRILLAAGADSLAVNQDGQTPADVARYQYGGIVIDVFVQCRHPCITEINCRNCHGHRSLEVKYSTKHPSRVKPLPNLKLVGGITHTGSIFQVSERKLWHIRQVYQRIFVSPSSKCSWG